MLALYGHPDSGGIWEKHCTKQLESVGWKQVLPEIWQSIYYHADLGLLLVIYVDDFKMAGPKDNMQKGWGGINQVLDMDPAEVFGRYFGCNHHEGEQVMLPREAHPFAHVFDKKYAALASRPEPEHTEDWWEVDPELGAVVRRHVYPRKRLYVPTEDDIQRYPTMLPRRVTEIDGRDNICDSTADSGAAKQKNWWTGRTYFPIVESDQEEFRLAVAARKGKWHHALKLINHLDVPKPPWLNKKGKDSDAHIVAKPQVLAALAGRPVHELASQLRRDKDFSHSALRSVIEALPKNNKKHMRKMIDSFAPSSSYTLFGQYTHGGLQGITKATQSNAEVCHYLNSFVKHHAPEDFRWTSVVISVNAKSKLRADVHNLSGSHNFTTSCGNYTGGQLWIEDPLATGPHASTQQLPNGSDLRSSAKSTKHQTVMFDPSSRHVVLPWKGDRFSIIAFSTRGFPKLSEEEKTQLMQFGFRLPRVITAAAHAPLTRRPLNYDRVMVEFCCSPESKLGQAREASKHCHVVRVTEADDATKSKTIQALVSKIHALCDEGGDTSKPLLLFASLPCTGGCPWQRINVEKNPELVQSHQELFIRLFKSFQSLCRMVRSKNPCIAFELPKNCEYWSWDIVKKFIAKYNLVPTLCDGCMLGVRDGNGLPIKKSWQISCTFPLQRLQAQVCDRSHSHGESRGPDLKHAEEYTFDMVDAIHLDWKDHAQALEKQACKGKDNSRQSQTLAACAILAGLASTPSVMTTSAGIVQQGRAEYTQYWHQSMWSASLAEEFKLAGGDIAYGQTVMASYEGCPPQVAVQVSFSERDTPGLRRLAQVSDQGLQLMKPESHKGRRRILVICSDSFTVFQRSNRGWTDLAGDLDGLMGRSLHTSE